MTQLWIDYLAAPVPAQIGVGAVALLAAIGTFCLLTQGWQALAWWRIRRQLRQPLPTLNQDVVRLFNRLTPEDTRKLLRLVQSK